MIHEFRNPMPVVTPLGDAYAIYVKYNGMSENDEVTCILKESGEWEHFTTAQLRTVKNWTYDINKIDKKAIK